MKSLSILCQKGGVGKTTIVINVAKIYSNNLVQEALCASDFYLIPTKPEFLAIEGVSQAMSFAKETISKQIKVNPVFLGVVLNQIETGRSSYLDFVKELEYLLADKLLNTKVSSSADVADSPYYLKTVEDFTNDNKSKKEFYQLANELLERMNINEKIIEQSYN